MNNTATFVIAEAGVNHNGDIGRARELIDVAADSGADAVKFQTFIPEKLASRRAGKAAYQARNAPGEETQLAMLQRLALGFDQHRQLFEHCRTRGLTFLSSPFDQASARFLIEDMRLTRIKLGSGELTNAPLLWQIAGAGVPMILSTGMADLDEVRLALGVCALGRQGIVPENARHCRDAFDIGEPPADVGLMHCTTAYPCPFDQVNLRAMDTLRDLTGLEVGYSDHTPGIAVSLAAVARGAVMIEKHFTLDRTLPGPDHAASIEPGELGELVAGIRAIDSALGTATKVAGKVERANVEVARKSIVAGRPIRRGEKFGPDNLEIKRPGTGLAPIHYWALLGTASDRDYDADEPISTPR